MLGQLDAHSIVIESRDGAEVITGKLAVQKVEELFKKLSSLGRMEEKSPHPVITEGTGVTPHASPLWCTGRFRTGSMRMTNFPWVMLS